MVLEDLIARYRLFLEAIPGIVSYGVGADAQGNPALGLTIQEALYDPASIPANIEGYSIQVRLAQGPAQFFHAPHTYKVRPLQPGVSIGPPSGLWIGTLGSLVRDTSGHAYIVSNNHVLADNSPSMLGTEVWQPSPGEGAFTGATMVAAVSHFQPFNVGGDNTLDVALARVNVPVQPGGAPVDLSAPSGLFRQPVVGETVVKSGRTTGLTTGIISMTGVTTVIAYDGLLGDLRFLDVIQVIDHPAPPSQPFSLGGDSGSFVYDITMNAVGILFAGDGTNTYLISPLHLEAWLRQTISLADIVPAPTPLPYPASSPALLGMGLVAAGVALVAAGVGRGR